MSAYLRPSTNPLRGLFLAGLIWAVACSGPVRAADPAEANPTGPRHDLDRSLLGEFSGPIATGPNKYEPLALQVRPIGNDNFEAIQYQGGLPGERAKRGKPVSFIGRRSGDFLVLSGGPWAIFVEKDHCLVVDRTGKQIGRLERVVRTSPTMGAVPPKDAVVLFDGTGTDQFTNAEMTDDGLLQQGATVRPMFQDFNLHAEFKLPYVPAGLGQARANSGFYLQSRYEVQVLDSFATLPVINGCGALYQFRVPDVNMCLPPLVWQTYDIIFTAPRWASDGSKVRNARITVWLNGIKVHDDVELPRKTGSGSPEEPLLLPIKIQDHKNPVRFRNIWAIDRGLAPAVRFPVLAKPAEQKAAKPAATAPKQEPVKKQAASANPSQQKAKPAPEKKRAKPSAKPDESAAKQTPKKEEKP